MRGESLGYRPDIDGLRAISVLLVLGFHLGLDSMPGGFVGVDAFFVISGYLITSIINGSFARGDFSFVRFYVRRTRRIFPALFVTVLLALVAGAFIQSPFSLARLAESGLAAMFSVSNIFFWSHSDYFAPDAKMQVLLHTWSLGVEEQFYLVWPAILILCCQHSAAD